MKKKLMQHLLTLAATALACATILIIPLNPDSPDPGNGSNRPKFLLATVVQKIPQPGCTAIHCGIISVFYKLV